MRLAERPLDSVAKNDVIEVMPGWSNAKVAGKVTPVS